MLQDFQVCKESGNASRGEMLKKKSKLKFCNQNPSTLGTLRLEHVSLMLSLLPVAWSCVFGDPGEAWQVPVSRIMKSVDLICSQFSPVKLKQSITPHDIYMEAVFLNNE